MRLIVSSGESLIKVSDERTDEQQSYLRLKIGTVPGTNTLDLSGSSRSSGSRTFDMDPDPPTIQRKRVLDPYPFISVVEP